MTAKKIPMRKCLGCMEGRPKKELVRVVRPADGGAVCVDATGAGDAFWGGFLSSLRIQGVEKASQLTREILEKAMTYGNVSGWICVQSKGAIESLPTRAQIESHL